MSLGLFIVLESGTPQKTHICTYKVQLQPALLQFAKSTKSWALLQLLWQGSDMFHESNATLEWDSSCSWLMP